MISLKQEPAGRLAAAEVMQQIPLSCKCIYIPTPSACGENPLLMAWMGRKSRWHLSALFSAGGSMVCSSCSPQQSSVSCFGAGRMGEEMKCSLAGVPSLPTLSASVPWSRRTGHPPRGPAARAALSATPKAAVEVGEGWNRIPPFGEFLYSQGRCLQVFC